MAGKPKKDAKKATDPNLEILETPSISGADAVSPAPEAGGVDAATVAAMMAQMQALMAEVTELRAQVATSPVVQPLEDPVVEDAVPERFEAVLKEMEEGGGDEDDSPSDVSKEETAQLLAGLDRSMAADVESDGAVEPVTVEEVTVVEELPIEAVEAAQLEPEADDMNDETIAQLLAEAAEVPVVDDDCDWEEDPDKRPFESANGVELTNEELAAMLAQVEQTGADAYEGETEGAGSEVEDGVSEPVVEAVEPRVEAVQAEMDAQEEDDLNDETIARLISEAAQVEVSDEDFDWEEDPDKRPFESANGAELTNEQLTAMIAQVQATGESVVEGEESGFPVEAASEPEQVLEEVTPGVVQAAAPEPVVEAEAPDDDGGVLGEDEIAALLASAQEKAEESDLDSGVLGADDEEEEELLSMEELAELVRKQIAEQDAPVQGEEAPKEVSNGAEWTPKEEPAKNDGGEVLSAEEIAALLAQPDPEGQYIPSESTAMDDDEIAQLLADAQNQQIDGVSQGSELGVPTPQNTFSEIDGDELPLAAEDGGEPVVAEAEGGPEPDVKKATVRAAKPSGEGPDLAAVKLVPAHAAIRAMAVPYGFEDGKLVCRTAEPVDDEAIQWISDAVGLDVVCEPYPILDVVNDLRQLYSGLNEEHAFLTLKAVTEQKPKFGDVVKSVLRRIA